MPTPAPSGPPLKKFLIHPAGSNAAGNPIHTIASSSGPVSQNALKQLRSELLQWRTTAEERIATRDSNSTLVTERLVNQKRAAEDEAKQKELDRRRKREEDERKDKERLQRVEKERADRQRKDEEDERRENEEYERRKRAEAEAKRLEDEKQREAAVKKARTLKGTPVKGRSASTTESTPEVQVKAEPTEGDASMRDASPLQDSKDSKPSISVNGKLRDTSTPPVRSSVEPDGSAKRETSREKSVDRKRKRDQLTASGVSSDSGDDQPLLQKVRKLGEVGKSTSPSVAGSSRPNPLRHVSTPALPDREESLRAAQRLLQEERFIKHSIPTKPPAPGSATAFYLPTATLVPPEPLSIPPPSNPKKQSEVSDDFSKAKPGNQVAFNTFHQWVDAYLRPFGEDDLAFLAPTPEDVTPYMIPSLGKHYLDQWDDEDNGVAMTSVAAPASVEMPPLQRVRPEALTEDSLGMENVYLGPLSERLVSAVAIQNKEQPDEAEGFKWPGSETTAGPEALELPPPKNVVLDAVDLEERIRRELRFVGLLADDEVDWGTREDDEISAALRQCQMLLHRTTTLNEGRKKKLQQLVKDRMAYQEYEAIRDAQERSIEAGWTKRSKTAKRKTKSKEKDKDKDGGASAANKPGSNRVPVSLALLSAVEKRHQLVSHLKPFFDEESQGRFFGLPDDSVYQDVNAPPDDDGISGLL